jgi:hypothetical protein
MRWVAVAILVGIGVYTWLTLGYRKPGPAYEPYEAGRERALQARLAEGGWSHFPAELVVLDGPPPDDPRVTAATPGTGAARELQDWVKAVWHLPVDWPALAPAPEWEPGIDYAIEFTLQPDGSNAQLVGFDVYRRQETLVVITRWEPGRLQLRVRPAPISGRILWPAAARLEPGEYAVELPALRESRQWVLTVP